MPPLVTHMVAARRAAAQVDGGAGAGPGPGPGPGDWGAYLLGATSPDVRMLTKWDRSQTHFFDLDNFEHQDSVAQFFAAQPQLRDAGDLNPATRAWTCGFLTHLIMDERYIDAIYRPHFGVRSPLGGSQRANLLDRILQYELDRREREDREAMSEMRAQLCAAGAAIECGLIDRPTLQQWRDVSIAVTENPPDWGRFAKVASRHLQRAGIESEPELNAFLEQVPQLLDETIGSVGMATVEAFFEEVEERTVACLREYLGSP